MERVHDATLYRLYKVSGEFNHYYELRRYYPLDQQELSIQVEIGNPSFSIHIHNHHLLDHSRIDPRHKSRPSSVETFQHTQ